MSTSAILLIVFGVVALLCVAASVAVVLMPAPEDPPPAAAETTGLGTPAPYDALPGQPAASTSAPPTSAAASAPLTSFGDGTHEVGNGPGQIPPGTYTAVVPDSPFPLCIWSRLRGFSGEGKDTITFGSGSEGEKMRVTIAATDKGFETDGCGTWTTA
jgi:hypothetical protein